MSKETTSTYRLTLADNGYILAHGEVPYDFLEVYEADDSNNSLPEGLMHSLLCDIEAARDSGEETEFEISITIKPKKLL